MLGILCGLALGFSPRSIRSNKPLYPNIEIPDSYNFLEEYPQCDFGPLTQECGICYAYGPLKAISHRICRATERKTLLSPQYIVACDPTNLGCQGGCSRSVFYFLEQHGVTDSECHPWQNQTKYTENFCTYCKDGTEAKLVKTKFGSTRQLTSVKAIKQEIYIYGPVTASVIPDDEMRQYRGGIYRRSTELNRTQASHSVEIIGWGVENNEDYWIVSNTYGADWGENGNIRIRAGRNDAGVENWVYAADPEE